MDKTSNINEMAEAVFHAMNTRDFSVFEQFITDDVVFDFPGVGKAEGSRRTLLLLKSLLRKYPKLHFTVSDIISLDDRACAVWTNEGEDIKGKPYANSGVTLLYLTKGKISFISDYFKDTSFVESSV